MEAGAQIEQKGINQLRNVEADVIKEISSKTGVVISTGGGAVLNEENIDNLKLYGKVFFLNRNIDSLQPSDDRPLTSTREKLEKVYKDRLPIYKKTCDEEIEFNKDIEIEIKSILGKLQCKLK